MLLLQVVKKPGLEATPVVSEMDLTYKERYGDTHIPEAYERLILDAIRGDQQHFVRRWEHLGPLLWSGQTAGFQTLPGSSAELESSQGFHGTCEAEAGKLCCGLWLRPTSNGHRTGGALGPSVNSCLDVAKAELSLWWLQPSSQGAEE